MSRRRRAPAWAATAVPEMARTLARTNLAEAARLAATADHARATAPHRPDLAQRLEDSARSAQASAATARAAELYWVTADMARIAMDASQDVPALLAPDAPAPAGLMAFAAPLPEWDTAPTGGLTLRDEDGSWTDYREPVPVDALTWAIGPPTRPTHAGAAQAIRVELHTRTHNLPLPLLHHQSPFLVPFTAITQALPAPLGSGGLVIAEGGVFPAGAGHTGVLALLEAAWVLMSAPAVATTTPATPPPAHSSQRAGRRGPSDVTVIDVRPARRALLDPHPDGAPTGRRLTTRHVVRGHWTHQPHGPGRSQRRLQWVDDYLRGPAGAPITTRAHVWAWRH